MSALYCLVLPAFPQSRSYPRRSPSRFGPLVPYYIACNAGASAPTPAPRATNSDATCTPHCTIPSPAVLVTRPDQSFARAADALNPSRRPASIPKLHCKPGEGGTRILASYRHYRLSGLSNSYSHSNSRCIPCPLRQARKRDKCKGSEGGKEHWCGTDSTRRRMHGKTCRRR